MTHPRRASSSPRSRADRAARGRLAEAAAASATEFIVIGDAAQPRRLRARGLRLLQPRAPARRSTSPSPRSVPVGPLRPEEPRLPARDAQRRGGDRRDRRRHRRLRMPSGRRRTGLRPRSHGRVAAAGSTSTATSPTRRSGRAAFRSTEARRAGPAARRLPRSRRSTARSSRASSTTIPTWTPSTGCCSRSRSGSSTGRASRSPAGRVVPVQQPEHDLVAGGLPAHVPAGDVLVPDDRHLAQLRRPADRLGERLGRLLRRRPTVRQERNAHDLMRDFARRGLRLPREQRDLRGARRPRPRTGVGAHRFEHAAGLRSCSSSAASSTRGELTLLDAWLADVASTPELLQVREARL